MSTVSGQYVRNVEAAIRGVGWASARTNRVELTVSAGPGIEFFTVERESGHGFQEPVLHEEFYPQETAFIFYDYTAPQGRDVVYRVTFFEENDQVGTSISVSVPTRWVEEAWT